jgi:2-keto-4-pentenoate hydratase/2-oxohepta-3-ene-1,7-dioic acid hydratase in catechol pathway
MNSVSFKDSGRAVTVGKILCLGRNYPEHAKEMKAELPSTPVVFLKPATAIVPSGGSVVFPSFSRDMHHEIELVVLVGATGRDIPKDRAKNHIAGYGVGLDMTLRDVQSEAKRKGLPWSVAKGFDTSAPVSLFVGRDAVPDPHNLVLTLRVNGEVRQQASTSGMVFRIEDIIAYLSSVFTLEEGDLIFTGTPEGVGPVHRGDHLVAELGSLVSLAVQVV